MTERTAVDVIVVGAGISGIYATYRMREIGRSVVTLERGDGVGGTWYWNRYPGLHCDVESIDYSYSFSEELQQEWTWSQKFATQPEILSYLEWVVDKVGVRPLLRFGKEVVAATWDDSAGRWLVETQTGEEFEAQYVIWGTGALSTPKIPRIAGMERFAGTVLNTATWPHEPQDFTGRQVAVLGTGSSGIQTIPIVAEQAQHLYVLQRTPSYSLPAHHRVLTDDDVAEVKATYGERRDAARATAFGVVTNGTGKSALTVTEEERGAAFDAIYAYGSPVRFGETFVDLATDLDANKTAVEFVTQKIRSRVNDQSIADKLIPDYPILSRRLCVDTGYYETFNRKNVTLIDLREDALIGLTETGFRTTKAEYDIDVLILATGFDALTGTLNRIDIRGIDGVRLRDVWEEAPLNYLGLAVAGFPNMFAVAAPGSPNAAANFVTANEYQVDWVADLLVWMARHGYERVEATESAQEDWVDHVATVNDKTVVPLSNSWFTGSNIEGKPRVVLQYFGGLHNYIKHTSQLAEAGYPDMVFAVSPDDEGILRAEEGLLR